MTTAAEAVEPTQPALRSFGWRRAAAWFVVTLLAITLFAVAFAVGYGRFHEGLVLPGVNVAGVDVAGLDRGAAETKLRQDLPSLGAGALTVRVGDDTSEIAYAEFDRDYEMELMLDRAFGVGRAGTPSDQLHEQMRTLLNGYTVPAGVTWDAEALAARIAAIAVAAESQPIDATITRVGAEYVVTPSVEGVAVDEEAAVAAAMAALNNLSGADTEIEAPTSPVPPAIRTEQAQAAADRANRMMAASMTATALGATLTIPAETIAGWVRLDETGPGEWAVTLERAPIEQLVDELKRAVDVPATNATYTWESGSPVVVRDAGGQQVDREAAISAIYDALSARSQGTAGGPLSLAVLSVEPEFTAAQAQALISRIERLSSWTTHYDPSSRNGFGQNIRRPTNLIDGTVLQPGETFDFVEVAGPITAANGYTSGAAIIHGNTQLDGVLGGGLCSCSTTLFNAALRAGLEMGARRNHAYYIDRYPVGLDATIWINGNYVQTMTFTNDTAYPILIRGLNGDGRVTFRLYGVPDGRRVRFSQPRITEEKESWTRYEYTDDLEPGRSQRVEYSYDGFKASVTRTVTSASGAILHENTYNSSYRRVIGHILVGREVGDPPAGTIVEPGKPPDA